MACYFRDCIVFGQSTKLVNLRTCNQLRTESLLDWHIVRVWCSCLQYHELFGRKARCWASDSDGTGKGSCTHPKLSVTYSIDTLMRWSLGCFSRMTFRQKSRGGTAVGASSQHQASGVLSKRHRYPTITLTHQQCYGTTIIIMDRVGLPWVALLCKRRQTLEGHCS